MDIEGVLSTKLKKQERDMEQRLSQSIVQSKSSHFAMHIAEYIHRQQNAHANLLLAKQLLRYGTSINDSVAEAWSGLADGEILRSAE